MDQPRKGTPWWSRTGTVLAADGTPLAFASGGPDSARAIVCANGLGVSTFFWDYVGNRFTKDHHVVVWDYRGHGASGTPTDLKSLKISTLAEDLVRVLDANRIERALLLGHSLGCQVILELHRLFPDRVLGLVPMLGAFGHPVDTFIDPRVGHLIYRGLYNTANRLPGIMNATSKLLLRSPIAWPFARITGLVHPDLCRRADMEPYLDHLARLDVRVFMEVARAAQEHDAEPHLANIRAPVLVVAGERDLFTPRHLSLELAQRISGAELLEIPRGSHAALIEQPELINLRLEKFIRERIEPLEQRDTPPADAPRPHAIRPVPPMPNLASSDDS